MLDLFSWDGLLSVGELLTLFSPMIILRNPKSFVPRLGSGTLVVALSLMVVALFGLGAPLGAGMTALVAASWLAVFILRASR